MFDNKLHKKTVDLLSSMTKEEMFHIVDHYCRPDMVTACEKKFNFLIDRKTAQYILAAEHAEDLLLSKEEPDPLIDNCPDWAHVGTIIVARHLDNNQIDALMERYCSGGRGVKDAEKLFGHLIHKETLLWLKENKPILNS